MPEHALAKLIRPWCVNGRRSTPETAGLTRSVGWPDSYFQTGGDNPEGEVFNQMFAELTAFAVELISKTVLLWDSAVQYDHPALCRGSNGVLYDSVQDSLNVNPVNDADGSHWRPLIAIATPAEINDGTDASGVVTPSGLKSSIYRKNFISARAPTSSDGADGDTWDRY